MSSVCLGFQACNKPAPVEKFKRTATLSFVSCFIRYYITSAPKCACSLNILDNLIKLSVTNGFMSHIFTCLHPFCRFLLPKSVQKKYADIQTCSLLLQPCIIHLSRCLVFKIVLILCSCATAQWDSLQMLVANAKLQHLCQKSHLSLFSWIREQRNTWCLWACLSSMRACSTLIY